MTKAELVLVPTPGMGHLLSAVQLAKLIVNRNSNVSVVILIFNFPMDENVVTSYVDAKSSEADPTKLTLVTLPPLSNPPDPTSKNFFHELVISQKPLIKKAVEDRLKSGSPKLAGFLLDMFCADMIDVANELQVPSYIFFTSGANSLNLMFHLQTLSDDGVNIPDEFSKPNYELNIHGLRNPLPTKLLPDEFLDKDGGGEMFINLTRRFRESKGIIANTFMELESYTIQTLLDQGKDEKIPPVYPIGPILELDNKSRSGFKKNDHDSIMKWLDEQLPSSVIFICFGSMGTLDEVQVKELAQGLEQSSHRFLWSLRRPLSEGKFGMPSENEIYVEALPEGFLDRTAGRGKIIGWAPQVAVLAHEAVAGFVSHCGWNSTLESLWFGKPMATWPLYAEQQLNAFELVKELGLAVEIRIDFKGSWKTKKANSVIKAEEIEEGLRKLMSMDNEIKDKLRCICEVGKKALQEGGSSHNWLGRFIEDVLANVSTG